MWNLIRAIFALHKWEMTKYTRTCSVCGRHEVLDKESIEMAHAEWHTLDRGNVALHWAN